MKKILLGLTASLLLAMNVQAELIDNSKTHTGSDSKVTAPSNQTSTHNKLARLLQNPFSRGRNHTDSYRVFRHLPTCDCNEKGQPLPLDSCRRQQIDMTVVMMIDEQGEVVEASLNKSSDIAALDRAIIEDMRQARFLPFIINGQPRAGKVTLPIGYQYTPNMSVGCHALREKSLEDKLATLGNSSNNR